LVKTTDQAFKFLTSQSPVSGFIRRRVLPKLMSTALNTTAGGHTFFRTNSQVAIQYRDSVLSRGRAGEVRGGDRLPYVAYNDTDNFAALGSLDWQVHVYGKAKPAFLRAMTRRGIAVREFASTPASLKAGLAKGGAYLVRPDGYVALAMQQQDERKLVAYLRRWSIKPAQDAADPITRIRHVFAAA